MKLHEALLGCSTGQLRRVAEAWGVPNEPGTLRHELVDVLGQTIVAGAGAEGLWDNWDVDTPRILGALARAHGRHDADLLVRRLTGPSSGQDDELASRIEQRIGRLIDRGLAFRLFEAERGLRRTVLILPDEITEIWQAGYSTDVAAPPADSTKPAQIARGDVAHDLFVLASALRREARSASSRGLVGRRPRTVAQVLGSLHAQVPDGPGEPARRWQFLLWVGKRLKWFQSDGWPLPDDDRIGRLFGDRAAIVREILSGVSTEGRSDRTAERVSDLAQLHADALQIVSELQPGVWWQVDGLLTLIGEQLGQKWGEGQSAGVPGPTRRAQAAVRRWLTGRWHWLGLIHWGWNDSGWSTAAVTALLVDLVAGRPGTSRQHVAPCEASEPFHLSAPPNADLVTLYRLERYLTYRGGNAEERRYDVTPASVARGIRLGGDEDELLTGLSRVLQGNVPVAWVDSIVGWCRANSALRVEPRILLVASDESTLDAALAVDDAQQAVVDRLASRYAVVAPDRLPELLTGLATAGLPVEVDPSLRVEPRRIGQAAALGDGVVEAAWVALDTLRRLGAEAIADQRDLSTAQRALEASLSAQALETLERRARTIAALVAERRSNTPRRPQRRKRVV
jgi:hypothetical protein